MYKLYERHIPNVILCISAWIFGAYCRQFIHFFLFNSIFHAFPNCIFRLFSTIHMRCIRNVCGIACVSVFFLRLLQAYSRFDEDGDDNYDSRQREFCSSWAIEHFATIVHGRFEHAFHSQFHIYRQIQQIIFFVLFEFDLNIS